ncbi:site-specific integrase [Bacillus sp. RO3]|nr:site-specific integrase [Bacillus sp. RO3]
MDYQHALDEFLLYLDVEKNYFKNTLTSYGSDLTFFMNFLQNRDRLF